MFSHRLVFVLLVCITMFSSLAPAQDKSVKPGINDSFRNPKPQEFVERFETESREVFVHRKEIVEACRIQPGMTVADIGAGTGLFTRLFASAVGDNGRVIAVDIAKEFLDHIQSTSIAQGHRNVTTTLCTPDSTELPESSIDLAFVCDTYHHFEFPLKTMASLHKALKPGGILIVVDFHRIEGKSSSWVLGHVRAGQDIVEAEIKQSGFRKVRTRDGLLQENYFLVFQKLAIAPELKTSLIAGVGGVADLTGAPEGPRAGGRIVLDVTSIAKPGEVNSGLERAARVLNLYGSVGLKSSDVRIGVVLHGEAALSVLSEAPAETTSNPKNPNLALISELNRAGVEVMVCGQTLARKQIAHQNVAEGVLIISSAMTGLMNRQADGYSLVRVQ